MHSLFGKAKTYYRTTEPNCQQDVFAPLVPSSLTSCQRLVDNLTQGWLSSTDLLQVVPTTCYRPAIHQFVNRL
jgi:hypothetical protein